MERLATAATRRAAVVTLLVLAWLGLTACAGMRQVPGEDRILFTEKKAAEGVFSSGPLMVNFRYSLQGQNLQLTGNVGYGGGYDSLSVYLLFVDGAGAVLQQKIVYYSGYRVGFWPGGSTFQANFEVPAAAAGFSFSYSAQSKTIRR